MSQIKDRDAFISDFVDHIIDDMDMKTLVNYAKEQMADHFSSCSDADLIESAQVHAPHLLEELE